MIEDTKDINSFEEYEENKDNSFDEIDFSGHMPSDMVIYNEQKSCADFLRMKQEDELNLEPHYQRKFVWSLPAQTRFIDSLIKGLPIPSLCFSLDKEEEKYEVVDGRQRIGTITKFLDSEKNFNLAKLQDVLPEISGVNKKKFDGEDETLRKYKRKIRNTSIPVTIIRCNLAKKEHQEYLFTIFSRLNTQGYKLNNQEIRNCIYSGPFNKFINNDLDGNKKWLDIFYGGGKTETHRFKGAEMILRFLAFTEKFEQYGGKLAKFLNDYMSDNKKKEGSEDILNKFNDTVSIIHEAFNGQKIPGSAVRWECLLFGVWTNLDFLKSNILRIKDKYEKIGDLNSFNKENMSGGTYTVEKVEERFEEIKELFSKM